MTPRSRYASETQRYSPRWWWSGVRNVFWVAVITLLIWVYADLEVSEKRDFTVKLRLTIGKAQPTVLLTKSDLRLSFGAKGTRRDLAQFQQWLRENDDTLSYDVSDYSPGPYNIPAVTVLNKVPDIVQKGLVVEDASQDTIQFEIDSIVEENVPVVLDYRGATLADKPTVEPPTVTVRVASSAWRRMQPNPEVRTVLQDLSDPGKGETFPCQLVPSIAGIPVELSVSVVTVTAKISQRTDIKTVTIDIGLLLPPAWVRDKTWQEYTLQQKDPLEWRREITVAGPKKDLDQLRTEDVRASVELTEDDKKPVESWLTRQVRIHLPPSLQLRLVGEAPTVQFKLVKRSEMASP